MEERTQCIENNDRTQCIENNDRTQCIENNDKVTELDNLYGIAAQIVGAGVGLPSVPICVNAALCDSIWSDDSI